MDLHALNQLRRPLAVVALLLAGCVGARSAPAADTPSAAARAPGAGGIERFLPLRDGFVLSYRVWLPGNPEPEQVIFQVERPSREHANLRSGNSVKRLALAPDGVRLVSGGYLLKEPLGAGAEWMGPLGRVRVTGTERSLDVSAGHFVGCIETTETGARGPRASVIVTSYCPDVGIVEIRVADQAGEQRFELRSFGPRVDIDAL